MGDKLLKRALGKLVPPQVAAAITAYEIGKEVYSAVQPTKRRKKNPRTPVSRAKKRGAPPAGRFAKRRKTLGKKLFGPRQLRFTTPPKPTMAKSYRPKGWYAGRARWRRKNKYTFKGRRTTLANRKATTNARRFYKGYNKRIRPYQRYHLRLYPGGFPETHIIKLRLIAQTRFQSLQGSWVVFMFKPSDPVQPLQFLETHTSGAVGVGTYITANQIFGRWTAKENTTTPTDVLKTRQPYGWDQWQTEATRPYAKALVLGSKITLNFREGSQTATGTQNFKAGFAKGLFGLDSITGQPQSFGNKYGAITTNEPSDAINAKVFSHGNLSDPAVGTRSQGKKFTYTYSMKDHMRQLKRNGSVVGDQGINALQSTGNTQAVYQPKAFFCISDLGMSAAQGLDCMVTIDYTIKLSGRVIPQQSEL